MIFAVGPFTACPAISGDTAMIGSASAPLSLTRERDAFPIENLTAKPYTLPYGYLLDQTVTPFGDGARCVALNRFEDGSYGRLMLYGFTGGTFVARDSTPLSLLPRGFGDSNGDGLLELLTQSGGAGIIYEQTAPGGSPLGRIVAADTTSNDFWPSRFVDGDGRDEILARTDNNNVRESFYYLARRNGGAFDRVAELPNGTPPGAGESRNKFGASESAVADVDGDGVPEILVGDDDADFILYRRGADGAFREIWSDRNVGLGGSEMVAAADIDGDGSAEVIVGFHSPTGLGDDHEYQSPFWTIKAFKFLPDGRDTLIWSEQFAYQRSRLPYLFFGGITSGDLDRRAGSEVAIAIYPNTYVFTWDSARRTLAPFWWRGQSNTNKPLIADFDGDGTSEIGVGDGESISFFSLDSSFRAPAAPTGLDGWALGDSSAYLEWNPVPDADYYTVYRGVLVREGIHFDSIAATSGLSITDDGLRLGRPLEPGQVYYYVVTTRDTSAPQPESGLSGIRPVFIHRLGRVVDATAVDARSITVRFSTRVREDLYRAGAFELISAADGSPVELSSVVTSDPSRLLLTLTAPRSGDTLLLRPTPLFRDYYDSPADSAAPQFRVVMPRDEEPGERFIAVRARPLPADTIAIEFNAPVDPATALLTANYRLSPGGEIASIMIDPGDASRVLLILRGGFPIGPLGRSYTITVTGVAAADGRPINGGAGSVVGFTIEANDLAGVFLYPQPFSISRDRAVTFAGLTRAARITIFTQSGTEVRTFVVSEGNGGGEWNGEDERGERLPPGIYLYTVSGTSADGAAYESEPGKIAILP